MIKSFLSLIALGILSIEVSCNKQNTPTPLTIGETPPPSPDYWSSLRSYKKSNHEIMFGWFGGSGGNVASSPSAEFTWNGLPDSVDLVSCWGGLPALGSDGYRQMQNCRQQKGMKVLICAFADNSGLLATSGTPAGFDSTARMVADTIKKYNIDGFDIDYEPDNFYEQTQNAVGLIRALSKYMGPASGTGLILDIDGYYDATPSEYPLIDYFITQAYGTSAPGQLQDRLAQFAPGLPPEKFIVTEDFEAYPTSGGIPYSDPVHGTIPSILGMAYWEPTEGRKAGCGSYHIEYDYNSTPDYTWTRQAIQIMNPPVQ